jgi:histidinol-phosphate aminotransferase
VIPAARKAVQEMSPYIPGEQPQGTGWTKLNTNENPHTSPKALAALEGQANQALSRYPDPLARDLRHKLAEIYELDVEWIYVDNGSDQILNLIFRAYVDRGQTVAYTFPTYPYYEVWAHMQDAVIQTVAPGPDFAVPIDELAGLQATLTAISNPNSPTGTFTPPAQIERLAQQCAGLVVVDEAYVDFASASALPLVQQYDNIIVSRSMSKSFGLAGVRVGYAFGRPELLEPLWKLRDSYSVSRPSQAIAVATLEDYGWMRRVCAEIGARRKRVASRLAQEFPCKVYPSDANFLFVEPTQHAAVDVFEALKAQKVLVRYFRQHGLERYLRITIGTEEEMESFFSALSEVLRQSNVPTTGGTQ